MLYEVITDRLGELVGERGSDAVARRHERDRESVRVADDEGYRHGFAERAAQAEHDSANHADLGVRQSYNFV